MPSRKKLYDKVHHISELWLGIRRRAGDLQSEEHENLGPDTGTLGERIDTKCLEGSEDHQNGGPSVPERERKVHEYLVTRGRRRMLLLDDVVDMLTKFAGGLASFDQKDVRRQKRQPLVRNEGWKTEGT